MSPEPKDLQASYAQTRFLLALWDLGGSEQKVARGKLNDKMKLKNKNIPGYPAIVEDLEAQGAIALSKKGSSTSYTLTSPIGLEVLGAGLRSGDFKFEGTIVGTWAANALLRWISQVDVVPAPVASGDGVKTGLIDSYDEFKSEIFDLFDKLDKSYNYSGLVPIWQIRKEVENSLQRDQFNTWIMDMQAEKLLYLQSGEARGATEEQKQDSINSEIRGLLFFVSKPL